MFNFLKNFAFFGLNAIPQNGPVLISNVLENMGPMQHPIVGWYISETIIKKLVYILFVSSDKGSPFNSINIILNIGNVFYMV